MPLPPGPPLTFPTPLAAYPAPSGSGLLANPGERLAIDPFNGIATAIVVLAGLHTVVASRVTTLAHRIQGQTLTNFAAPPVWLAARVWGWDTIVAFHLF